MRDSRCGGRAVVWTGAERKILTSLSEAFLGIPLRTEIGLTGKITVYSTGNYIYYLIVTYNGIQSAKILNTPEINSHKSTII